MAVEPTSESQPEPKPYKGRFAVGRTKATVQTTVEQVEVLYYPGSDEGLGVDPIRLLKVDAPETEDAEWIAKLAEDADAARQSLLSSVSQAKSAGDTIEAALNEKIV